MQTTANAHDKALQSKDNERDARIAPVGPTVKVVNAHVYRVCRKRAAAPAVSPCALDTTRRKAGARILGRAWACAAQRRFAGLLELLGL